MRCDDPSIHGGGRLVCGPSDLPVEERQLVRDLAIPLQLRRAMAVTSVRIDEEEHGAATRCRSLQARGHLAGLPGRDARII